MIPDNLSIVAPPPQSSQPPLYSPFCKYTMDKVVINELLTVSNVGDGRLLLVGDTGGNLNPTIPIPRPLEVILARASAHLIGFP